MKRLKLDFQAIQVDSFDTTVTDQRQRGTVRGRETAYTECAIETGSPCQEATTMPCQAGTYAGDTCDSTCYQIQCTCTYGGELNGTCDINTSCNYYVSCAYQTGCYDECG